MIFRTFLVLPEFQWNFFYSDDTNSWKQTLLWMFSPWLACRRLVVAAYTISAVFWMSGTSRVRPSGSGSDVSVFITPLLLSFLDLRRTKKQLEVFTFVCIGICFAVFWKNWSQIQSGVKQQQKQQNCTSSRVVCLVRPRPWKHTHTEFVRRAVQAECISER